MARPSQQFLREITRLDWIVYIAVVIFFVIEEVKVTLPIPFQVPFHAADQRYWASVMIDVVPESTIVLIGTSAFIVLVTIEFLLQAVRLRDQAMLTGSPPEDTFLTAAFAALRLGLAGAVTVLLAQGTCELFREHVGELTPDFGQQCFGVGAPQLMPGSQAIARSDADCVLPVLRGRQGFISDQTTLAFSFAIFLGIHAVTRTSRICHQCSLPEMIGRLLYQLYLVFAMGAFLLAWGVAQNAVTHNRTFSYNTFGAMILATMVSLGVFFAIDTAIERDIQSDYPDVSESVSQQEKAPFATA